MSPRRFAFFARVSKFLILSPRVLGKRGIGPGGESKLRSFLVHSAVRRRRTLRLSMSSNLFPFQTCHSRLLRAPNDDSLKCKSRRKMLTDPSEHCSTTGLSISVSLD